jgi:hypothetical protein
MTADFAVCEWSNPGYNRYTGTTIQAISQLGLPQPVVKELQAKVVAKNYDDQVKIGKSFIQGKYNYLPDISYMHFGTDRVCKVVTRTKWDWGHEESGLVYCVGDSCVLIPAVCGNVALINKKPFKTESTGGSGGAETRLSEGMLPLIFSPLEHLSSLPSVIPSIPQTFAEVDKTPREESPLFPWLYLLPYQSPNLVGFLWPKNTPLTPPTIPDSPSPVSEPGTLALVLLGLVLVIRKLSTKFCNLV